MCENGTNTNAGKNVMIIFLPFNLLKFSLLKLRTASNFGSQPEENQDVTQL